MAGKWFEVCVSINCVAKKTIANDAPCDALHCRQLGNLLHILHVDRVSYYAEENAVHWALTTEQQQRLANQIRHEYVSVAVLPVTTY